MIVAADGKRVRSPADLRRAIGGRTDPGDAVRLTVRRGRSLTEVDACGRSPTRATRSARSSASSSRRRPSIKLPLKVKIDAGDVGGPSAGLAFALDVLEELGQDVDHGRRIAATGELELDGTVGAGRRPQAEDDRRRDGRDPRLPRPGWGKRRRGARAMRTASGSCLCTVFDRRCARWQRCQNPPLSRQISPGSNLQEIAAFSSARGLHRPDAALRSTLVAGGSRGSRTEQGRSWPRWPQADVRRLLLPAGRPLRASDRRAVSRPSAPTRAARSLPPQQPPLVPRRPLALAAQHAAA